MRIGQPATDYRRSVDELAHSFLSQQSADHENIHRSLPLWFRSWSEMVRVNPRATNEMASRLARQPEPEEIAQVIGILEDHFRPSEYESIEKRDDRSN